MWLIAGCRRSLHHSIRCWISCCCRCAAVLLACPPVRLPVSSLRQPFASQHLHGAAVLHRLQDGYRSLFPLYRYPRPPRIESDPTQPPPPSGRTPAGILLLLLYSSSQQQRLGLVRRRRRVPLELPYSTRHTRPYSTGEVKSTTSPAPTAPQ